MTEAAPADSLEERWREWLLARNRRGTRTALWIVITLYPGFGLLDYLLAPPQARTFLWSTRAVVTLATLAMFAVVRRHFFARYAERLSAAYMVLCAAGISVMTVFMGGLASPYYAGLSLAMVAIGLLFVWPGWLVFLAHASIVATFVLPNLLLNRSDPATAVSNLFFLVSTGIIASVGQIVALRTARAQVESQMMIEHTKGDLERANQKLQQVDRLKSQFFANVTHELRTPLTMILAPIESILSGDFGPLTNVQRSYMEANWRNGVRLLKLINDLLDLAKMGEGFLRLRPEQTDLERLVQEIVAYSRPLAARKKLALNLVVARAPENMHVDVEKLERVVVNLVSNALKFTESGGVTVNLDSDAREARITVADTGIGIPAETIPTLFERFSQGDTSITRRFGGTGLGLAYAKEIVELHGGRITVTSTPGEGSQFAVHLIQGEDAVPEKVRDRRVGPGAGRHPKRRDDQEPVEWALRLQRQLDYRFAEIEQVTDRRLISRADAAPTTSGRILVVEDNVEILELINLQLRDKYTIFAAQNGVQGLELARRERPDVVVTDFMMPEMDGLTMLKAIREEQGLTDMPVIMLTAKNQLEDRLSARQAGADVYLEKPFSPRELEASIRQLLQKQGRQVQNLMRAHVEGLEIVSAGLAHEIHNPLNFIKNANLLIAENVGKLQETLASLTEVPPERTGAIDKIRGRIDKMVQSSTRGVERIEKVVDLIRRYAREGYPTEASEVDFDLAVAEVTELVAPRADMEGRVTEQLGAPGWVVRAIPEELNQVIRGLVQNACESVGPTGKVHVGTRVEGAHVVLEVTDNGPGISPENVAKIFSPFFTTKPGSGRGMGLAIVQIVINRIGGTVEVTSTPGVQTAFRVRLPATEAPVQPQAQASAAGSPAAPLN
jgi:signal transduction histidine kinase